MGERLPCKQEASGSNPLISTNLETEDAGAEALFFENRIEKQKGKPFSLEEENGYYTEHGKTVRKGGKKG